MKLEKKTYDLTIAGLPYKLKTYHDDETVRELVEYVDTQVQMAMKATKSGSFQSAAVLAALNIAEEFILLKRKTQQELIRIENQANEIVQELRHPTKGPTTIL